MCFRSSSLTFICAFSNFGLLFGNWAYLKQQLSHDHYDKESILQYLNYLDQKYQQMRTTDFEQAILDVQNQIVVKINETVHIITEQIENDNLEPFLLQKLELLQPSEKVLTGLRMLLVSALIVTSMCKSDIGLIGQRVRSWFYKNRAPQKVKQTYDDLQLVYFGQTHNQIKNIFSENDQNVMFLVQIILIGVAHCMYKYLITLKELDELFQEGYIANMMFQNNFLILINGNDCSLAIINLIFQVTFDYVEKSYNLPQQFQPISHSIIQQFLVLFVIAFYNQMISQQHLKNTNELNNFLITDEFWPNNFQILSQITLKQSFKEKYLEKESDMCFDNTKKLIKQCLYKLKNNKVLFFEIEDLLEIRILRQNDRNLEFQSNNLSLAEFSEHFSVKNQKLLSEFLLNNVNYSQLRNTPSIFRELFKCPNEESKLTFVNLDQKISFTFNSNHNIFKIKVEPIFEIEEKKVEKQIQPKIDNRHQDIKKFAEKNAKPQKKMKIDPPRNKMSSTDMIVSFKKEKKNVSPTFKKKQFLQNLKSTFDNYNYQDDVNLSLENQEHKVIRSNTDSQNVLSINTGSPCDNNDGCNQSFAQLVDEQIKDPKLYGSQTQMRADLIEHSELNSNKSDKRSSNSEEIKKRNTQIERQNSSIEIIQSNYDINSQSMNSFMMSSSRNSMSLAPQTQPQAINKVTEKKIQSLMSKSKLFNASEGEEQSFTSEEQKHHMEDPCNQSVVSLTSGPQKQLYNFQVKQMLVDQIHHSQQEVDLRKRGHTLSGHSSALPSSLRYSQDNLYKEVFINKIEKLQSKLKNNKIFMNMVIHDMRNPTTAIQFGVTETIQMLQNQQQKMRYLKKQWKQRLAQMRAKIQKINTFRQPSGSDYSVVSDEQIMQSSMSDQSKVARRIIKGYNGEGSSNNNSSIDHFGLRFEINNKDGVQNNISQQYNMKKNSLHHQPQLLMLKLDGSQGKKFNMHQSLKQNLDSKKFLNSDMNLSDSLIPKSQRLEDQGSNNDKISMSSQFLRFQAIYYGLLPRQFLRQPRAHYQSQSNFANFSVEEEVKQASVEPSKEEEKKEVKEESKQDNLHNRRRQLSFVPISAVNSQKSIINRGPGIASIQIMQYRDSQRLRIPAVILNEQEQEDSQIDVDCEFAEVDCDEGLESLAPKIKDAKLNDLGKIGRESFIQELREKFRGLVLSNNISQDQIIQLQSSLNNIEHIVSNMQVREQIVFVNQPIINSISRGTQYELPDVRIIGSNVNSGHAVNQSSMRFGRLNYGVINEGTQCNTLQEEMDNLKQQITQLNVKQRSLIEQNIIQKEKIEELSQHSKQLSCQVTSYQEVMDIYEAQMNSMEDQEVFENVFLVKIERFLQNAVFSATMLNNLINDMLDLAKFEAGTFKFHDEFFDFIECIENAFETIKFQAGKKQIQLNYQVIDEREKNSSYTLQRIQQSDSSMHQSLNNKSLQSSHFKTSGNGSNESAIAHKDANEVSNGLTLKSTSTNNKIFALKNMFYRIYGDKNRYTQILLNFLSNGINYTDKGGNIQVNLVLMEEQIIKSKPDNATNVSLDDAQKPLNLRSREEGSTPKIVHLKQNLSNQTLLNSNRSLLDDSVFSRDSENESFKAALNSKLIQLNQPSVSNSSLQHNLLCEKLLVNSSKKVQTTSEKEIKFQTQQKLPTEVHGSIEHLESNNQSKFIKFRIEIADTGVGIKKEDMDKLFTDFSRLDKDMNKKGTGLGLSICKKMIEKMGGKVEVDSTYGVGTTFKVILQTKVIPQTGHRRRGQLPQEKSEVEGESHSLSISNNQSSIFGNEYGNSNSDLQSKVLTEKNQSIATREEENQRRMSYQHERLSNNLQERSQSSKSFTISSNKISAKYSSHSSYKHVLYKSNRNRSSINSASNQSLISVMKINDVQSQNQHVPQKQSYIQQMISPQLQQISFPILMQEYAFKQVQRQKSPALKVSAVPQEKGQLLSKINEDNENSGSIRSIGMFDEEHMRSNPKAIRKFPSGSSQGEKMSSEDPQDRMPIIDSVDHFGKQSFSFGHKPSEYSRRGISGGSSLLVESHQEDQSVQSSGIVGQIRTINSERHINPKQVQSHVNSIKLNSVHQNSNQCFSRIEERGFNCLAANDCDFQLQQIQYMLQKANVTHVSAINGLEALDIVQKSEIKYDFIILDLNMPILDGYEACRKILDHYNEDGKILASRKSFKKEIGQKASFDQLKNKHILDMYDDLGQQPLMVALSAHITDDIRKKCLLIGFNIVIETPLTVKKIEEEILSIIRQDKIMKQNLDSLMSYQMLSIPSPSEDSKISISRRHISNQIEEEESDQNSEFSVEK